MSILRRKDIDMTSGGILRHLIAFCVPLLIGNLFQQVYNTVDSIVVGNFVGTQALAAVGSVGPIINTLIGTFLGLSAGAGVVISQFYGAHQEKDVHDVVHTTILMTFILSIVFTIVGVLMVPAMLRFMSTPDDVFNESAAYLRIYFWGISGLMIYNMGAGILRAVGDSQRPLYFLIVSAVVNTVLDLAFVIWFDMGIAGVAWATVIAQGLSAVLVLITLVRTSGAYKLIWRDLHIHGHMLKNILRLGLPSAVQSALTAFSNVFVQGYINQFGSACMAGYTSYAKVDQFALLPMQTIALFVTTFVGQNIGAGDRARARTGIRISITSATAITAVLLVPLMLLAPQLIMMFDKTPEVVDYGAMFTRWISPFYLLCGFNQIYAGALRGAGDSKAPMLIMLLSFVVFRQLYLFVVSQFTSSALLVAMGYPAGWLVCSLCVGLYYKFGKWEDKRVVVAQQKKA